MDIQFNLPAKAVDIINDLIEKEYEASAIKIQLGVELLYLGFRDAHNKYIKDSAEELSHAKLLTDFLIDRGSIAKEPEMKIKSIGIKDLTEAIKKSYRLEIEVTQAYDEAVREMFALDIMAYNKLQDMISIQASEIRSARQAYMTFEHLSIEDQRQMEGSFFGGNIPLGEG